MVSLPFSTDTNGNFNFGMIRIDDKMENSAAVIPMSRLLRHPRQLAWIVSESPKFESKAMHQINAYRDLFGDE
ncbi:hypothetical protein niasHT_004666 [Heterodera trifolii]|uniref:Uncharacterized protein n=1 Tax=Heterodera trifolii TaxID=157864 RepID=A0ABD2MAM6_9BILA